MRVFWNLFIILIGIIGIAAGILYSFAIGTIAPVGYVLIFGGAFLIIAPIFRWALTPSMKHEPSYTPRPAPHAPHHRYGAFEVKTAPGPRDWRPPTDN